MELMVYQVRQDLPVQTERQDHLAPPEPMVLMVRQDHLAPLDLQERMLQPLLQSPSPQQFQLQG